MGNQRAPRTAATHAMRVQQLVNVLRDTPGYTRGEWQTDAKLSRAQSYTDWVRRAAEYDAEEDRLWRQSLMPPALAPFHTHLPRNCVRWGDITGAKRVSCELSPTAG